MYMPEYYAEKDAEEMTFEQWKREVDKIFVRKVGLTSDDVEDYLWYDAFDGGASPGKAFEDWACEQGINF